MQWCPAAVRFMEIGGGKAVLLFVWAWMKLHLQVYRGTVRHSDVKERLSEVLLRHAEHHFPKFTAYFFWGGGNHCSRRRNVSHHLDGGSTQRIQQRGHSNAAGHVTVHVLTSC